MKPLPILISTIISTLGMATLLSCQESLFYTEYKAIPSSQWDNCDTLSFKLPQTEHTLDASLTVSVRTRQDCDYKTIALTVEHLLNGAIASTDTLHITLYDANEQSRGHAFPISDNYSRPLPLHIEKDEHHTIRIAHIMRPNPLENIPDVGIFVEPQVSGKAK